MNCKRVLLTLLALLLYASAYAYKKTYAVIVGVADYQNFYGVADGDLQYTVSDAVVFYDFLRSRKGGAVPASNICLLLDEDASRENIVGQAKRMFGKADKDDRVVFFFSGHGGKGYFLPYDYTRTGGNVLYYNDVKAFFRVAKSKTKLMFVDACFSGRMRDELQKSASFKAVVQERQAESLNIAVMMSSQGDQTSSEDAFKRHGKFTYHLTRGLEGRADDDGNGYVTVKELFYYVYKNVKNETGGAQVPVLFGKFDPRLIVATL